MKKIRLFTMITVIFPFTILISCATAKGSLITTGNVRPAIDPNTVKIYIEKPSQYETIGIVEASIETGSSKQAAQDRVIEKLKEIAAKVGANGVLITNIGEGTAGGYFIGGVYATSQKKSVQGVAIYVIKE